MLHDGTIESWKGNRERLVLKVSCLYLAELIDKGFEYFYVQIENIRRIEFVAWMNSIDMGQRVFTELEDIFKADLEILSVDIRQDDVQIICNQHDTKFEYFGGNLIINCSRANIFDHNNNLLVVDEFVNVCKKYWDGFSK